MRVPLVDRRRLFAHWGESVLDPSRLVGGSTRGHPQDHPHDHTHEAPPRQHAHRGLLSLSFLNTTLPMPARHRTAAASADTAASTRGPAGAARPAAAAAPDALAAAGEQVSPVGAPSSRRPRYTPPPQVSKASAESPPSMTCRRGSGAFSQAGTSRELTLELEAFRPAASAGLTEDEGHPAPPDEPRAAAAQARSGGPGALTGTPGKAIMARAHEHGATLLPPLRCRAWTSFVELRRRRQRMVCIPSRRDPSVRRRAPSILS